jgi:hypothetical protein
MANGNQRTDQGRASNVHELVVDGLPPCTIARASDGMWHVTAQVTADEQAALTAAAFNSIALFQRAQHALGLAGIGSRIASDDNAIGIYTAPAPTSPGAITLVLDGRALLWLIAGAPSEVIRALIAAAIAVMHTARDA